MQTTQQSVHYKLSANDQISVKQSGGTPVLEIGNKYQFELPQGNLQQFVTQWEQAGSQLQTIASRESR